MKKKITSIFLLIFLFFGASFVAIKAADSPLGETIVRKSRNAIDLPTDIVLGSEIKEYEYEGTMIYDFREYFEILDNGDFVLRVYRVLGEEYDVTDRGGYEWNFNDFDPNTSGTYTIEITYTSEFTEQTRSANVKLKVIEEDVTPPIITGMENDVFNITKNEEQFLEELRAFMIKIEIYDSVDGLIDVNIENFQGLNELQTSDLNSQVEVTLVASDNAGNETSRTITLTLVDRKAPYILNLRTVVIKRGAKNPDIISHIVVIDNYDDEVIPQYEYYGSVVYPNLWEITTDTKHLRGKPLKEMTEPMSEEDILNYAKDNFNEGYDIGNYIKFNKPGIERTYYAIIKEKEAKAIYKDKQDEIDFNRVGVQYVYISAVDQAGNVSGMHFRVVIENSLSLLQIALIINGIVLGVASIGIGIYFVIRYTRKGLEG